MNDVLKPMLCQSANAQIRYPPSRWAAEGKFDGWRMLCHRREDGSVYTVGGRNGSDYSGKAPYIEEALEWCLPPDSIVDGEVVSPLGCSAVGSAIGTNHPHEPSECSPALQLVVFDLLRLNGHDCRQMPWESRRGLLEKVPLGEGLRLSPILPTANALGIALDAGLEGVVLKLKTSRYVSGYRSPNWLKIKPQQNDLHAKVIGFKPGKGGLTGMVGALEFELVDTGVQSSCGIRGDKLREEITANPDAWLGATIEIRHHGLTKDGKPRHPVLERRRYDLEVT